MSRATPQGLSRRVGDIVARVVAVCLFFAAWLAVYKFFNNWNADPVRAIRWERPVDLWPAVIQPWTAYIYVFAGYVIPLVPFLWYRTWPRIGLVLSVYLVSSVIAFAIYWLFPLAIARPDFTGDRLGEDLMRAVLSVDNDANCCPSFHTSFAILAWLLVAHGGAGRLAQASVGAVAVAICITTVTTGQHYVIDVVGGVLSALVSYHATAWWWGRNSLQRGE